jgi:hypothetical protein
VKLIKTNGPSINLYGSDLSIINELIEIDLVWNTQISQNSLHIINDEQFPLEVKNTFFIILNQII